VPTSSSSRNILHPSAFEVLARSSGHASTGRNFHRRCREHHLAQAVFGGFQADAALNLWQLQHDQSPRAWSTLPVGEKVALARGGWPSPAVMASPTIRSLQRRGGRDPLVVRRKLSAFEPSDNFPWLAILRALREDEYRIRAGKQLCKKEPAKDQLRRHPITGLEADHIAWLSGSALGQSNEGA